MLVLIIFVDENNINILQWKKSVGKYFEEREEAEEQGRSQKKFLGDRN